jgi:glyceraldehyde-3-phosphate dehydrogenase/erythrose-4-phosphate dehydrogenase
LPHRGGAADRAVARGVRDLRHCCAGVDLAIEATDRLRACDDAAAHLKVGARRVLLSAPGKNVDATW